MGKSQYQHDKFQIYTSNNGEANKQGWNSGNLRGKQETLKIGRRKKMETFSAAVYQRSNLGFSNYLLGEKTQENCNITHPSGVIAEVWLSTPGHCSAWDSNLGFFMQPHNIHCNSGHTGTRLQHISKSLWNTRGYCDSKRQDSPSSGLWTRLPPLDPFLALFGVGTYHLTPSLK